MDSVQVGKAVFEKKVTLPWESNAGPTPIQGHLVTISVTWVIERSNPEDEFWQIQIQIQPKQIQLKVKKDN